MEREPDGRPMTRWRRILPDRPDGPITRTALRAALRTLGLDNWQGPRRLDFQAGLIIYYGAWLAGLVMLQAALSGFAAPAWPGFVWVLVLPLLPVVWLALVPAGRRALRDVGRQRAGVPRARWVDEGFIGLDNGGRVPWAALELLTDQDDGALVRHSGGVFRLDDTNEPHEQLRRLIRAVLVARSQGEFWPEQEDDAGVSRAALSAVRLDGAEPADRGLSLGESDKT